MSNNEINLFSRGMKWISLGFAILFILIGLGILTGFILPGQYLLKPGTRLIFGGFILGYGIVRLIMIYMKGKKAKIADKTLHGNR